MGKPESNHATLKDVSLGNFKVNIKLAGYGHLLSKEEDIFGKKEHFISDLDMEYESYRHIAGIFLERIVLVISLKRKKIHIS
ncbi:hypothetical protein H2O64_19470 [Kordia sp. YSTF-M3]|uniref:Uncharacterized protein n=1 Tax=Kordia aestuariivivens TaxID=2759037 RepID=A0ABR7QEA2_9FLAO|nr:hypothetical protein [Kordia aestuariivivens]MBC8756862.1 hypothetical protein [Kordia aestuariivivens]